MPLTRKHKHEPFERVWNMDLTLLTATVAFIITALVVLLWDMF